MLANVVAVHSTTRALQVFLNMLMVASLDVGWRSLGRSLRPLPTHRSSLPLPSRIIRATGRAPWRWEIGQNALHAMRVPANGSLWPAAGDQQAGLLVPSRLVMRPWDSVAVRFRRLHYYKFER
jgi:hypothetical protein